MTPPVRPPTEVGWSAILMLIRRGVITADSGKRAECCGLPRDDDGFCIHRPGHPIFVSLTDPQPPTDRKES